MAAAHEAEGERASGALAEGVGVSDEGRFLALRSLAQFV